MERKEPQSVVLDRIQGIREDISKVLSGKNTFFFTSCPQQNCKLLKSKDCVFLIIYFSA